MRVLVCGDRNWTDYEFIYEFLRSLPADTIIIEGEASGADKLSAWAALALEMQYEPYPADWKTYGRAAGPIRNTKMLTEGKPDEVHAFHDNIETSRGTRNMMLQAKKAGIAVYLHAHDQPTRKV